MAGFIKLYRSINKNDLLENDNTAYIVFTKLLTRVDRHTGSYTTGRFKLASLCNIKPSTLYSALKRLETAKMIRQQSNNKMTTIHICNWWKYQQDIDSESKREQKIFNTKQEERKEKENIDTKVSNNKATKVAKAKTPSKDINQMFEVWTEVVGYSIESSKQKNRYACSNLLKKHGKDGVIKLINGVAIANNDKFAPRISDFSSLQAKFNDLVLWGKKQSSGNKPKGVDL